MKCCPDIIVKDTRTAYTIHTTSSSTVNKKRDTLSPHDTRLSIVHTSLNLSLFPWTRLGEFATKKCPKFKTKMYAHTFILRLKKIADDHSKVMRPVTIPVDARACAPLWLIAVLSQVITVDLISQVKSIFAKLILRTKGRWLHMFKTKTLIYDVPQRSKLPHWIVWTVPLDNELHKKFVQLIFSVYIQVDLAICEISFLVSKVSERSKFFERESWVCFQR